MQNKVPAKCLNVFAKWKDHWKEQSNTYTAIQTMPKHFVSSLNSRQAVHKHYSRKPQTDWVRLTKKVVTIESLLISRSISNSRQLTALHCCLCCCAVEFTSTLTLMSPTLLFIHSLLPKLLTRLSFMCARC